MLSTFKHLIQALRINQYLKNILVFVPLLTGHYFSLAECQGGWPGVYSILFACLQ